MESELLPLSDEDSKHAIILFSFLFQHILKETNSYFPASKNALPGARRAVGTMSQK